MSIEKPFWHRVVLRSSLLGPLVSYEENELLWKRIQMNFLSGSNLKLKFQNILSFSLSSATYFLCLPQRIFCSPVWTFQSFNGKWCYAMSMKRLKMSPKSPFKSTNHSTGKKYKHFFLWDLLLASPTEKFCIYLHIHCLNLVQFVHYLWKMIS